MRWVRVEGPGPLLGPVGVSLGRWDGWGQKWGRGRGTGTLVCSESRALRSDPGQRLDSAGPLQRAKTGGIWSLIRLWVTENPLDCKRPNQFI